MAYICDKIKDVRGHGDDGIVLWTGAMILSLTGIVTLIASGKKRSHKTH